MPATTHSTDATRFLCGSSFFVFLAITASSVVAQEAVVPDSADVNVRFAQKRVELAKADLEVAKVGIVDRLNRTHNCRY